MKILHKLIGTMSGLEKPAGLDDDHHDDDDSNQFDCGDDYRRCDYVIPGTNYITNLDNVVDVLHTFCDRKN